MRPNKNASAISSMQSGRRLLSYFCQSGTMPKVLQSDQTTGVRQSLLAGSDVSSLRTRSLLSGVLEAYAVIGIGLIILGHDKRLHYCNRVADAILSCRDGIELGNGGTLQINRGRGFAPNTLFERLPHREESDESEGKNSSVLAVRRPSGKRPLAVIVRQPLDENSLILVFLIDPEHPMNGMESHLRQFFELTPAETQLAMLLMQGNNLIECCERMSIRRPTAATHLQRLFKKTNVRTQSQLVSTLFRRFGLLSSDTGGLHVFAVAGASDSRLFAVEQIGRDIF